jgi:hypothetical protein
MAAPKSESSKSKAVFYTPDWLTKEAAVASENAPAAAESLGFMDPSNTIGDYVGDLRTKYHRYYADHCSPVNAKTFSEVKKTFLSFLEDKKCPIDIKNAIGVWLFKTVYTIHKIRVPEEKRSVVEAMFPVIDKISNLVPKGFYLQYRDQDATTQIAVNFYLKRFSEKDRYFILQMLNDVQLLKNASAAVLASDAIYSDDDLKKHFLSWMALLTSLEQRSNLLDVLLRQWPNDDDVKSVYAKMRYGGATGSKSGAGKNIYTDAQNAHDDDILESALLAAENLIAWARKPPAGTPGPGPKETPSSWIKARVGKYFSAAKKTAVLTAVIERAAIDTTSWGSGFTIADTFLATVRYIASKPKEVELNLIPILIEEMDEMKELCSSGYVERFVTVLQGQDPAFDILISEEKRLYSILSYKLGQEMVNASEEVSLGAIQLSHRQHYIDFVKKVVNRWLPTINVPKKVVVKSIDNVMKELIGEEPDETTEDGDEEVVEGTAIDLGSEVTWVYVDGKVREATVETDE